MKPPRAPRSLPVTLALALALGVAGVRDVAAQNRPPPVQGTALETEAYRLYTENKLVTARARAEAVLRADPDSIIGNYVLGCVLREAEGSLPRALYHLGHSRQVYESRYGTNQRPPGAPWQLHRETLYALQSLAGELEEYEYQYQVLEFYDYLYDPDLTAEHAWPLLHLHRYDEARNFARRASQASDPWQRSLGLNALCAIEGAARQRQPEYQACLTAFQNAQRRQASAPSNPSDPTSGQGVAVHAYNAALAAWSIVRHDEVERLAREGARRLEFTIANPWRVLVRLYLDEGRATEAVSSLHEMQRWRIRQPANLRDQDHAETDATVATVLLIAGEAEAGLRFADRALDRPDRRGLVSSQAEASLGANALLRRALARTQAELLSEQASYSSTVPRVGNGLLAIGQRLGSWGDDERVTNVLTDEERLFATLRQFVRGGLEPVPPWLVGDLVQVLGPGVVSVMLRDVRAEDRAFAPIQPYFDGVEAEVALAQGDYERAVSLAQRALQRLPQAEVILHARVAAVGAEAARRDGNDRVAYALFERAMQKDPGVIRRLGLALPARVQVASGNDALEHAGTLLERSPRLRDDDRGFIVRLETAGRSLRACLRNPMNAQMSCATVSPLPAPPARQGAPPPRPPEESPEDYGARLAEEFHRTAFAMRLGLSSTDLRSLDGSTTVASEAERERMRGVIRDITQDPSHNQ